MKFTMRFFKMLSPAAKLSFTRVLLCGIGLFVLSVTPAHAQMSYATGIGNVDLGARYATVPPTKLGGIFDPGGLASGIAIPTQPQTYPGLFSYMAKPNAILNDATSLNKALSELFPKENVVDIIAYNKAVDSYNHLAKDLADALVGAKALPGTTPIELQYKKNVLDVIAALTAELERIGPKLNPLGQAIKKAI